MNPETKKDWKYVAGISAVVAGAFIGGIVSMTQTVPAPPTITLAWTLAPGAAITEIEGTTNFVNWYPVGSVTNTNYIVLPRNKPQEFFRASHPNRVGHYWDTQIGRYYYQPDL